MSEPRLCCLRFLPCCWSAGLILVLATVAGAANARSGAAREADPSFIIPPRILQQLAAPALGESISVPSWPVGPGMTGRVHLVAHDVYAPGARVFVIVDQRRLEVPRSKRIYLWGEAEGDPAVRVMVSVAPGGTGIRGLIFSPGGNYSIEPVAGGPEGYVRLRNVRRDLESKGARPQVHCGFEKLGEPFVAHVSGTTSKRAPDALATLHTATVAVDTDNELMSQKFGNDTTAAANYIADLFAAMNVMYERDLNVRLLQGTTFLRINPDPYDVQDPGGAGVNELAEFANYWAANYSGIDRALAMLLSGRSPSSSSASGIAYLAGLCSTSIGYSFNEVFKIDYLAGDAKLVGHELGHNFGSPHTHCYNPPIDHCYNGESGCYTGPQECPLSGAGTVMSYCHLLSGCDALLEFHPTVVALIDTYTTAAEGTCLFPLPVGLPVFAASDYTANNKADIGVYRNSTGYWYIRNGESVKWGVQPGDLPVPGDYDGDGKADIAVYRNSNGYWYIKGGPYVKWGVQPGDIPVPGDYNGDGTTDIAVYRNSDGYWYIKGGHYVQWGVEPGDIPVPGDYNGDGTTDIAIFRPSNGYWYIKGGATVQWGVQPGDIPVPADYDGDGTTDIAVYRHSDGYWYIKGGPYVKWGIQATDIPVQADYNGDNKANIAVYRNSNGYWYIKDVGSYRWGVQPGDVPIARGPR